MVKPKSRRRQQGQAAGEEQQAEGQQQQRVGHAAAAGRGEAGGSSSRSSAGQELADGVAALRLGGVAHKVYPDADLLEIKAIKVRRSAPCCTPSAVCVDSVSGPVGLQIQYSGDAISFCYFVFNVFTMLRMRPSWH
jgi:hypothetical protein